MATKRQVLSAIRKKWPGATLEVMKIGSSVDATIDAPSGFYLSEFGHHFLCLEHWYTNDEMSAYWDQAIEDINSCDGGLTKCNDPDAPCCESSGHADCEFLDDHQREEYWERA